MEEQPRIAIVMGSDSDLPVMKSAVEVVQDFDLHFDLRVMSAHRSPEATHKFASDAEDNGLEVIIAGAGGAAHLAGVIASVTPLPVIGVPMPTDRSGGVDSLYSTLQMPRGVPVACMGIGSSGAKNAALLAIQILSLGDEELAKDFREFKANQVDKVDEANRKVQDWLAE